MAEVRGGGRSVASQAAGDRGSRNRGRVRDSLGKGKPEIERERLSRNPVIDGRRIDSRTKSKIGDARRAGGDVGGDGDRDRRADVAVKTKGDKIVDEEESRANRAATTDSFKSGVV